MELEERRRFDKLRQLKQNARSRQVTRLGKPTLARPPLSDALKPRIRKSIYTKIPLIDGYRTAAFFIQVVTASSSSLRAHREFVRSEAAKLQNVAHDIVRSVIKSVCGLDINSIDKGVSPEVDIAMRRVAHEVASQVLASIEDQRQKDRAELAAELAERLVKESIARRHRLEQTRRIQAAARAKLAVDDVADLAYVGPRVLERLQTEVIGPAVDEAMECRRAELKRLIPALDAVQRYMLHGPSATQRTARYYAFMQNSIERVQAYGRFALSSTHVRILGSGCFLVLQRIGRGLQDRQALAGFRDAVPAVQSSLRSLQSVAMRRALFVKDLRHKVTMIEACWTTRASASYVRCACTKRAVSRLILVQGACRSVLLQLLTRRLLVLRVSAEPPTGVNRVLHRLLYFMPGEDVSARRAELVSLERDRRVGARNVRRVASTPDPSMTATGPLNTVPTLQTFDALLEDRGNGPQRSRLTRSTRPTSSNSHVSRQQGPVGARAAYAEGSDGHHHHHRSVEQRRRRHGASPFPTRSTSPAPDHSAVMTRMAKLVSLAGARASAAPRGRRGGVSKADVELSRLTPTELVQLAQVTAVQAGPNQKKPTWC